MKRHLKIFLLCCQAYFTERGRSFVWFLMSLIPPFAVYLYWRAALPSHGGNIQGWSLSSISSYYFLLIIASSLLIAHIEEHIAFTDIYKGEFSFYILKPYSYYVYYLFTETPYRLLQGGFALIPLFIFLLFFGRFFTFTTDITVFFLAIIVALLAYLLSFTFKMVVGLSTFWTIDANGLFNVVEAITFILAGLLLPLSLMPAPLARWASALPFSYMIYYPIRAFQGALDINQMIFIIFYQIVWIVILFFCYRFMFKKGVKKYTGVGN